MNLSKSPYRGTRDFFPHQKRERDYLFQVMEKMALRFGYEPYDGPLLEEVELYKAKSGEELINEQIYSFTDRGERFVAIRPEMTPTLARMIAQVHREVPKPIRWFSMPNLMRYEKPQRGRLREHWQFNCDLFGAPETLGEAEIISLLVSVLNEFGANHQHFELLINDRRLVDGLFKQHLGLNEETLYRIYKIIDRAKKMSEEALQKVLADLNLTPEALDIINRYLKLESFDDLFKLIESCQLQDIATPLKNFLERSKSFKIYEYLKYDPSVVRGLDYYTGIVFEAFDKHPDNRRALCGGGAYSHLLKIFNEEPVPGVGFGLGDVTLTDFLKTHNLMPDLSLPTNDLLLTSQDDDGLDQVFQLAAKLRERGLKVVTSLEAIKFKKVFALAQKRGVNFVALMGSDEIAQKQIQIKNLQNGQQQAFALEAIDDIEKFLKG